MIIYHTPIMVETIAKNGSERYGANASCTFGTDPEGKHRMIDLTMHGKTKAEAIEKIKKCLAGDFVEVKEITLKPEADERGDGKN
jgi:hypothetical protein